MCLKCLFGGNQLPPKDEHQQQMVLQTTVPSNTPRQIVDHNDVQLITGQKKYVKAMYDYQGMNPDDLPFCQGDIMELLEDCGVWWKARMKDKEGFIPSNYVQLEDGSVNSLEAWMVADRRESERNLLLPGYISGTYLIRPCSGDAPYALSIRSTDADMKLPIIKHYKIKVKDDGSVFIAPRLVFSTVKELVNYYSKNADGLCEKLTDPCPKKFRPPVEFRDIEVSREAFNLVDKLGSGSFGDVFRAKWNRLVEVAIKTIKAEAMEKDAFIEEAKAMHNLRHPKILQILGICTIGDPVYIITEMMINGALLSFLKNDKGKAIKYGNIIDMVQQIADGMSYLEEKNYVHRDLRAANILVGESFSVKVSDFGLAKLIEEDIYSPTTSNKFPVKWTPPEAYQLSQFSVKSDVWSFGILIYEMVTYGGPPYPGKSNKEVMSLVANGYRMEKPIQPPSVCDDSLYDTMLSCWQADPLDRPTFRHFKNHFENFVVSKEAQYQ